MIEHLLSHLWGHVRHSGQIEQTIQHRFLVVVGGDGLEPPTSCV
jgi:hypothetical protein